MSRLFFVFRCLLHRFHKKIAILECLFAFDLGSDIISKPEREETLFGFLLNLFDLFSVCITKQLAEHR